MASGCVITGGRVVYVCNQPDMKPEGHSLSQ